PAARRVLRIGDVAAVDMERLVALRPDVVVAWPAGGNPAQREKIARLHIPVYEQQVVRLADLPVSVRRLGALAGTAAAAERAAHDIETRFAALTAVRSGRLVVFEDQALSRLGPSVVDATEALCRTLARVRDGGVRRGD